MTSFNPLPHFTLNHAAQALLGGQRIKIVSTTANELYFIDGDAQLFEHILRYLRRGVLSVFYDNIEGHDHTLYLALLEEAKHFQIPQLEKWIENRTYLQAVKISYSATELDGEDTITETTRMDIEIEHHPSWITKRIHVRPRGIYVRKDNPDACGRMYRKAQGYKEDEYVEQVLKTFYLCQILCLANLFLADEIADFPYIAELKASKVSGLEHDSITVDSGGKLDIDRPVFTFTLSDRFSWTRETAPQVLPDLLVYSTLNGYVGKMNLTLSSFGNNG